MRWKLQAFEKSKSDKKADSIKVRLSDGLQWSGSVGLCPYFLHLSQTHWQESHNGCSNLNASETASGFERFKHVGHWQFVHLEMEMTIRDNRPVRG